MPHAELKIWLYADPTVRAARRHAERDGIEVEVLADEMRRRDERDAANTHRADDAIELDTTFLDLEQVIDRIEALVQETRGAAVRRPRTRSGPSAARRSGRRSSWRAG